MHRQAGREDRLAVIYTYTEDLERQAKDTRDAKDRIPREESKHGVRCIYLHTL